MKINSYNIFKWIPPNNTAEKENNKVSYWLEKLHKQREENKTTSHSTHTSIRDKVKTSPERIGLEQNTSNQVLRKANDKHKVEELVRKSNRKITSISSTFPWKLFPNTIEVEESKVTFIFRQFMSFQSHSVEIRDISNVFIESSFLFAKLQVVSRTFIRNDIKVDFLRKKEALEVKNIIDGLRTFTYNNIDTSNYDIKDLKAKLRELYTH